MLTKLKICKKTRNVQFAHHAHLTMENSQTLKCASQKRMLLFLHDTRKKRSKVIFLPHSPPQHQFLFNFVKSKLCCFCITFFTGNAIHFRFHFTMHRSFFSDASIILFFDLSVYDEISTEILCGRCNTEHGWVINRLIKVFDCGKHHATAPAAKTT